MKRKLVLALVLGFMLGLAGLANAAVIDVTKQISSGNLSGIGVLNWSFGLPSDFSIPPDYVNKASLTIWGHGSNLDKNDSVVIEQILSLGTLGRSVGTFSHPDSFPLTQYFRSGVTTNNTFDVSLVYIQDARHTIEIDGSRLFIKYTNGSSGNGIVGASTAVSEPGMLMLLGTGLTCLVGLVGYRRMRRMQ